MDEQNEWTGSNSLTPIELDVSSVDVEAAQMSRGKGFTLAGVFGGAVVVLALALSLLGKLDQRQIYLDAAVRVESVRQQSIKRFWNCVLVGANPATLRSVDDIESSINQRAEHFGAVYGTHLKRCGGELDQAQRELDALTIPLSIAAPVRAMEQALAQATDAVTGFTAYLAEQDGDYDVAAAESYVSQLALSWDDLRRSHVAFRSALHKQLHDQDPQ